MSRRKRKQSFLIRVDEDVRRKLDKIKSESPYIRLSYNDILITLLWEYRKKQQK
jgi:hypothetical protein